MKAGGMLFLLVFFLAQAQFLQAQPRKLLLDYLSVKDGLADGTVHAVIQDKYHLMWFGTPFGLDRFDGRNFYHYRQDPGKLN